MFLQSGGGGGSEAAWLIWISPWELFCPDNIQHLNPLHPHKSCVVFINLHLALTTGAERYRVRGKQPILAGEWR